MAHDVILALAVACVCSLCHSHAVGLTVKLSMQVTNRAVDDVKAASTHCYIRKQKRDNVLALPCRHFNAIAISPHANFTTVHHGVFQLRPICFR